MKLNKEGRQKLREEMDYMIASCSNEPEKNSLTLEKEVLECLIFDEYYKYKKLAYNSENLKYFDLKELSFEDVSLNYSYSGGEFNFEDCNIYLDFTKTYEYKTKGYVDIRYINFYGVDLSNNNSINNSGRSILENAKIFYSTLGYTGLKITTTKLECRKSNLIGIDLSELTLSPSQALEIFDDTNVRYTNLNVDFGKGDLNDARSIARNDYYVGCNLIRPDGKIVSIPTIGELSSMKTTLKTAYDDFEKSYIDGAVSSIKNQINNSKNKTLKKELPSDPVKFMKQVKGDLYMGN